MRAVVLSEFGGPEKLEVRDLPRPEPRAGHVLVKVAAAGVCGRDLIDRRGGYRGLALPAILGHEFAGEVVELGPGVDSVKVGDQVAGLIRSSCGECRPCGRGEPTLCEGRFESFGQNVPGVYAELVSAPASVLLRIPDGVSYEQAAPLACTAGVAMRALRTVGRVRLGETVLVTGASGGVGMAAVQLAKRMGARVVAVTGSSAKAPRLAAAGADEVVIANGDFHEEVRKRTGGVDVSLELTGSATFGSALRSLRNGGRLVLVGNILTEPLKFNPGAVILFGYEILGTSSCTRADLADALDLVSRRELEVVIDRTLPLDRVAEAHQALSDRATIGRVVLVP